MDIRFHKFRFSAPFNRLTNLGMWPAERPAGSGNKFKLKNLFFNCLLASIIALQLTDLYFAFGNFRKVTFNVCTSVAVAGYQVKIFFLYRRRDCLNELRLRLWRDSLRYNCNEDVASQDAAHAKLKHLRQFFYIVCFFFVPIMLISSYFSYLWGVRELPFAAYLPVADPSDDSMFIPALLFEGVCAFYVVFVVIEAELCMFSLIFQISGFYNILIKNINKINEIYEEEHEDNKQLKIEVGRMDFKKEVNRNLRKELTKKSLKDSVIRHLELIDYAQKFEYVYNRGLFVHITLVFLVSLINSVELTLYLTEFSVKLCFQIGFIATVLIDMLVLCQNLSTVTSECEDVGNAVYSILWYKMDVKTRKELIIMMIRSRNPPRLTAGKLFLLDLNTYLHLIRDTYSWLMLMRQIVEK